MASAMSDDFLNEAITRIDRELSPSKVVLFGSRARTSHQPDSDVDLLIVFSREVDRRQTARDIRWFLRDLPLAFDVVVATEDDLVQKGDQIGLVFRPALREGRVLLEHGRAA
jgi:uncharacterized protein